MVGQDVQGPHRRAADVADRALPRARGAQRTASSCSSDPSRSSRSPSTGCRSRTRYPGGVALRFARVVRYRADKDPAEADTIEMVQALLPGAGSLPEVDDDVDAGGLAADEG